ncbi:hypothetical protein SO694_000920132 [Aureococcus anophagefferens]|uniref:Uncharacterized protein n=1 Tax=Aureococcus anophagefferens TaxID=44056 RepID=A0ABR1FRQ6_AURAN
MAFAAVASARDPEDPRDAAAPGRRLLVINALEDGASVDIFYAGARGRGVWTADGDAPALRAGAMVCVAADVRSGFEFDVDVGAVGDEFVFVRAARGGSGAARGAVAAAPARAARWAHARDDAATVFLLPERPEGARRTLSSRSPSAPGTRTRRLRRARVARRRRVLFEDADAALADGDEAAAAARRRLLDPARDARAGLADDDADAFDDDGAAGARGGGARAAARGGGAARARRGAGAADAGAAGGAAAAGAAAGAGAGPGWDPVAWLRRLALGPPGRLRSRSSSTAPAEDAPAVLDLAAATYLRRRALGGDGHSALTLGDALLDGASTTTRSASSGRGARPQRGGRAAVQQSWDASTVGFGVGDAVAAARAAWETPRPHAPLAAAWGVGGAWRASGRGDAAAAFLDALKRRCAARLKRRRRDHALGLGARARAGAALLGARAALFDAAWWRALDDDDDGGAAAADDDDDDADDDDDDEAGAVGWDDDDDDDGADDDDDDDAGGYDDAYDEAAEEEDAGDYDDEEPYDDDEEPYDDEDDAGGVHEDGRGPGDG